MERGTVGKDFEKEAGKGGWEMIGGDGVGR
jgi:hypothetical protein